MAAPSNTVWGNIVTGSKSTRKGRIGISATVTNSTTSASVKIQVWFWSMYSVQDSNNSYYFNGNATSATTLIGSKTINHTVDSGGGWSTSNQTLLGETTYTYTKGTTTQTKNFSAKFTGIDSLGESNVMTVTTSVTIGTLLPLAIKYNANGGSGAPGNQTKYWGKSITLSSTKPTRTGYTFQSWNTKSDGTGTSYAPGATYTGNTELTLYAIWKIITYTITYNGNGGTASPATQTKNYGTSVDLSGTATRTDYTFKGWATSAGGSVTYSPGSKYTANASVTLYAVWELAYVKPRITNVSVIRSDSTGMADDNGTYALVSFNWATDKDVNNIVIDWTSETAESGYDDSLAPGSGKSGSISIVVGEDDDGDEDTGVFSVDSTYTIRIVVADMVDTSYAFSTLPGVSFPIDILEDVGIAFGKPAELEGVADFGWKARFNEGILPPVLPPETNLNDILTPNTYIGANLTDNEYLNCPVSSGTFTLVVNSCGESGQVRQEYICCSKYKPERYVRFYYQSNWGDWFWSGTEEYIMYPSQSDGLQFENASGTNGSVTLNASVSHFKYLEIYFTDNNGKKGGYTKIINPVVGDAICLSLVEAGSNIYIRQSLYVVQTETLLVCTQKSYTRFGTDGAVSVSTAQNYIKITKVVGRA